MTGKLSRNASFGKNYSLTLEVNRLSGDVPNGFVHLAVVNILNGNMFSCDLLRTNLPHNDKDYLIYQCGSNSFEVAVTAWAICVCILSLFTASLAFLALQNEKRTIISTEWTRYCLTLVEWNRTVLKSQKFVDLCTFCDLLAIYRVSILQLASMFCIIGVPVYVTLSVYFKTLTSSYAWFISAAFLSGIVPSFALMMVYSFFVLVFFMMWYLRFAVLFNKRKDTHLSSILHIYVSGNCNSVVRSISLLFVNLFNSIVMITVNGGYVYVILNYSTRIVFTAQLSIALFKLFWNDFAVKNLIKVSSRYFENNRFEENLNVEISTMTFIVLFNTIIAPCLATAAVDPSCFVNSVIQPPPVTSTFPNFACGPYSAVADCRVTSGENSQLTTSYDPPFIYNYQCTSAILTNYASVYVYMFLMVAFIKPLFLVVMERIYKQVPRDSLLHVAIDNTIYNLLKPAKKSELKNNQVLFKKERFILRLLSKLAVFLTFGVVFPPIAVVICVAFYSETFLQEIIMGRFLSGIEDEELRTQFAEKLNKDCEGSLQMLVEPMIKLVVPFAAIFYAFFIFDIYGDQVGWRAALLPAALMASMPAIIWLCYKVYLFVQRRTQRLDEQHAANIEKNVEMPELNADGRTDEKGLETETVENILHVKKEIA